MFFNKSLRYKINTSILILLITLSIIFGVVLTVYETERRATAINQIEQNLVDLTHQESAALGNEIFAAQVRALKSTVKRIRVRGEILAIIIYDDFGEIVYSTDQNIIKNLSETETTNLIKNHRSTTQKWGSASVLTFESEIQAFGETAGFWKLHYSLNTIDKETKQIVAIFSMLILSLAAVILIALNSILKKLVLKPVYALRSNMEKMENTGTEQNQQLKLDEMVKSFDIIAGNLEAKIVSKDEIASLSNSFRNMIFTLKSAYIDVFDAEKKYRSIFENAIEGLFQTSSDGKLISVNNSMAEMLGYDSPKELAESVISFSAQCFENINDYFNIIKTLLSQGSVAEIELQLKRKDNSNFWGLINMRKVEGAAGELLYYEGSISDITERLEKEKAQREKESVRAAANARREFLDNSGQGFLSFGNDLKVSSEFSNECVNIFNGSPKDKTISELLFVNEIECNRFIKNVRLILNETDEFKQNLYLPLLKEEYLIGKKHVHTEYKILDGNRMMMIFTDISLNKELENEIQNERNRLKFIVTTVKEKETYFELIDEYNVFISALPNLLASEKSLQDVQKEIYRHVHTLKGHFSQQDFLFVPTTLHNTETKLSELRYVDELTMHSIESALGELNPDLLDEDTKVITSTFGDDFSRETSGSNKSDQQIVELKRLFQELQSATEENKDEILRKIQDTINLVPLNSLLSGYIKNTMSLAASKGISINPFAINGGKLPVNPKRLTPFTKSLLHVFTNIVEHGADSADEREELDKSPAVNIECSVEHTGAYVVLTIEDDGAGLDSDRIATAAVAKGVISDKERLDKNENEIFNLIFEDSFSTKESVSSLSGRGVGLSAVKAELKNIGGHIELSSKTGQGTTFKFFIPDMILNSGESND